MLQGIALFIYTHKQNIQCVSGEQAKSANQIKKRGTQKRAE